MQEPAGYSEPIALDTIELAKKPLPTDEGPQVMCLVAGKGTESDASWVQPANALPFVTVIDTTQLNPDLATSMSRHEPGSGRGVNGKSRIRFG